VELFLILSGFFSNLLPFSVEFPIVGVFVGIDSNVGSCVSVFDGCLVISCVGMCDGIYLTYGLLGLGDTGVCVGLRDFVDQCVGTRERTLVETMVGTFVGAVVKSIDGISVDIRFGFIVGVVDGHLVVATLGIQEGLTFVGKVVGLATGQTLLPQAHASNHVHFVSHDSLLV